MLAALFELATGIYKFSFAAKKEQAALVDGLVIILAGKGDSYFR